MLKLRFQAFILTIALFVSMFSFLVPINAAEDAYTEEEVMERILDFANKLGIPELDGKTSYAGKYFTVNQEPCSLTSMHSSCSNCLNTSVFETQWFKNIFGEVSIRNISGHYYPNGGSCHPKGWTCSGFASFAQWAIFAKDNNTKVTNERIVGSAEDYKNGIKLCEAVLDKYARPGDIIRDTTHSYIYISHDSEGVWIIDSNYSLNVNGVRRDVSRVKYHKIKYTSRPYPIAITSAYGTAIAPDRNDKPTVETPVTEVNEHWQTTANLRIRSGPSTSYSQVGLITSGDTVTVTKIQDNWGYTTYSGVSGWICLDYAKRVDCSEHPYDEGKVTKEATCKEEGEILYTCSNCGDTKTETVKTGKHSYDDGVITKEATCNTDGLKTYTCKGCGETKTEEIPSARAHIFDEGKTVKEATCKASGSIEYTCLLCGETKYEAVDKTEHEFSITTEEIAPTCTAGGKTAVEECIHCGETRGGKSISKTGHDFSEWVVDVEPTCTERGTKSRRCSICNAKGSSTSIAKIEHTYGDWEIVTPAQPGKKGSKERTCLICNYVSTKSLAALPKKTNDNRIIMTVGCTDATVFGKAEKIDVAPMIVSNRTMLPARFVAENLGATVEWDAATRKVTITGTDAKLELYIDNVKAFVNDVETTLDSAPFIMNDRTFLPVRFIAESLGASVEWDGEYKHAIITKG